MTNRIIYFKKLLKEFEKAAINISWKGSQPPEDWEAIDEDYINAKQAIINYVAKNFGG